MIKYCYSLCKCSKLVFIYKIALVKNNFNENVMYIEVFMHYSAILFWNSYPVVDDTKFS